MNSFFNRALGLDRVRDRLKGKWEARTLPIYHRSDRDSLSTSLLVAICIVYALLSGYFLGVFQQYILQQFLIPIILLVCLVLWALPDRMLVSHKGFERTFFTFIAVSVLWPAYLAIAIPGLPWITLGRLTLFITLIFFLVTIAIDRSAREKISAILREHKFVRTCFILFVVIQFLTVPLAGPAIETSFPAVIDYQLKWSFPLLMALIVFSKPGSIDSLARLLVGCTVILCFIAFIEFRKQQLPWVGKIPSFLQVDDPSVARVLAGARRSGDGLYRVQTTFTTSLSCAEFMAMVVPFVMHYILTAKRALARIGLICLYFAILATIIVTRSRLGMIGFGIAHLTYPLLIGLRRWATMRNDLVGPSLIALYPALLGAFMAMLLASRRLYVLFLGGGAHQASNDARETMYSQGIPLILKNPWGFGADHGASVLGFVGPSGVLTIDSYYLSIGLDYGVLGFLTFYGMLLAAVYLAVRVYLTSADAEARIAAPVAITLGSYFVIKSVLSQSQNQYLMYILVGVAVSLSYRFWSSKKTQASVVSGGTHTAAPVL